MMEVDQPVGSQVDKEVKPGETAGVEKPESSVASPDKNIESDDLPSLVISDSEGDEPLATEADKIEASKSQPNDGDISGITPLNVSVIDVDAQDEDASKLEAADNKAPKQEDVPKPAEDSVVEDGRKEPAIYDNIDLTGTSSPDDSGVSDPGASVCEPTVTKVRHKKVVKDYSNLTAQELLQQLLEPQEDSSEEETPINEPSGVETQLDQEKVVLTLSGGDPVEPVEQNETVAKRDKSASEEPESLKRSESPPSTTAENTVCAEEDSKQLNESVTVAQVPLLDQVEDQVAEKDRAAEKEQAEEKSVTTKPSNGGGDDDDDVVCLLEEMDDPYEFDKDEEEDDHDGSGADSNSSLVDDCEGQSKGDENEGTTKAVPVESKTTEEDSIDEPPNKRPRSERHDLDEGDNIQPSKSWDNLDIGATTSSQHSNDNRGCTFADSEVKNSGIQAESQSSTRSRPSSRNTEAETDTDANVKESTQTRPEDTASQYSDVLVIDDDDDDDDDAEMDDAPVKTVDKIASADMEARGKRSRDVDESESTKKSKPEDATLELAFVAVPIQDSGVNVPKLDEQSERESQPLPMEFMQKWSKPLSSMSRNDLEELVQQKISEAMRYESKLAEERKRVDKFAKGVQNLRQRMMDMAKHYSDLKVVHDRVVMDLRRKANRFVQPVKITRAVGLQVNQPLSLPYQTMRASMESSSGAANRSAELSVIPANGNGSQGESPSGSGTAGNTSDQTANNANGTNTNVVQRTADGPAGGRHPPPNVIRTSRPMNVTYIHNATASAVTITPTGSSRQETNVERPRVGSSSSSSSSSASVTGSTLSCKSAQSGGSSVGSITARKKTVHKITPKRPPLSAVQQEEQNKMARQQQELFLRDMYNQQARMAKITAISTGAGGENSPAVTSQNVADAEQSTAAASTATTTTTTTIRTALVPPQASVPPQVSAANSVRATIRLVAAIANSTAPPAAGKQMVSVGTSSEQQQPPQPSPAACNSLIDLTDEEESPKVANGSGAASNLPAQNRQGEQNATPGQSHTPTIASASQELIASNQMVNWSLVRQQNKIKVPQRFVNGYVVKRPSGTKVGSIPLSSVNGIRPGLSKRPPGQLLPPRLPTLVNGQARPAGPLVPLHPAGPAQRPQIKLPNHPAPLPLPEKHNSHPQWKRSPPRPVIRINNVPTGIVISWTMPDLSAAYAAIEKYQIYAYQETAEQTQTKDAWRHVGDVNSLALPMAVTLTHFNEGQRYHFAVRAIDQHKRSGFFSDPRTW